jgi:hypothetical protein
MPAEAAQGVIEYLKANPEAAKVAWQQAQTLLKTPGLANALLNMPVGHRRMGASLSAESMKVPELHAIQRAMQQHRPPGVFHQLRAPPHGSMLPNTGLHAAPVPPYMMTPHCTAMSHCMFLPLPVSWQHVASA